MIYVTYNSLSGALIDVVESPPAVPEAPLSIRQQDIVLDYGRYAWDAGSASFVERPRDRNLTKRQYLGLFTGEERVSIRAAAKASLLIEDYLALLNVSDFISLDDPDTISWVQALEAAGLLSPGRAAEILA